KRARRRSRDHWCRGRRQQGGPDLRRPARPAPQGAGPRRSHRQRRPQPDRLMTPSSTTTTEMLTREIGNTGITATAVGLGTWAIGGWMWGGTDEAESIAAIRASMDAGITLIDTAPAYGMGRSEEIVGKA